MINKTFVISCLTANSKHYKFEYSLVKTFLKKFKNIKLILIVRKKGILPKNKNIKYIEFKNYEKNFLNKLYVFYYKLFELSKKLNSDYWLSTDNLTPRIFSKKIFTYYHTPSPFFKGKLISKKNNIKFFIQGLIYGFFIKILLNKNNSIIVQSNWLKKIFIKKYKFNKIIVAPLEFSTEKKKITLNKRKKYKNFIYPSYPHIYKNFELLGEVAKILDLNKDWDGHIVLTFDPNADSYSRKIYEKYNSSRTLKFIGHQTEEKIKSLYKKNDALIFPSFMETWGLPISEAKKNNLPIILPDLEYAYETVGSYYATCFINPTKPDELASLLIKANNGINIFKKSLFKNTNKNYLINNEQLVNHLLKIK